MDFFLDNNGLFGGLLALLFIGFLLHVFLMVLVALIGRSFDKFINHPEQPADYQTVVSKGPRNLEHVKLSDETKIRLEIEWAEWQKKRGLIK